LLLFLQINDCVMELLIIFLILIILSRVFHKNSQPFQSLLYQIILNKKLKPSYKQIIETKLPFYQKLSDTQKKHFERRVQHFIDIKEFIPRGTITTVSDEMKALIAGTAIQLTFGYPHIYFRHFKNILIFPDKYYSNITKNYHYGEVNMRGAIVLSWNRFIEGIQDYTDGRNLGIHEMAHALIIENKIDNTEFSYLNRSALKKLEYEAYKEINNYQVQKNEFLRKYATTNLHEFFAVSVEYFYERPEEFHHTKPELFNILKEILRFDPIAVYKDSSTA